MDLSPSGMVFGFAYLFSLVVTNWRIISVFLNDSFTNVRIAYLKRPMKETGKVRRQVGRARDKLAS